MRQGPRSWILGRGAKALALPPAPAASLAALLLPSPHRPPPSRSPPLAAPHLHPALPLLRLVAVQQDGGARGVQRVARGHRGEHHKQEDEEVAAVGLRGCGEGKTQHRSAEQEGLKEGKARLRGRAGSPGAGSAAYALSAAPSALVGVPGSAARTQAAPPARAVRPPALAVRPKTHRTHLLARGDGRRAVRDIEPEQDGAQLHRRPQQQAAPDERVAVQLQAPAGALAGGEGGRVDGAAQPRLPAPKPE